MAKTQVGVPSFPASRASEVPRVERVERDEQVAAPSTSASPPAPPPGAQFLQGGVIYTPDTTELGLHSLSDGPPGEKPPYPYPTIIRCAILGSPRQRLTLSEIYVAMENRYPWFKTAGQGWKVNNHNSENQLYYFVSNITSHQNSVRHNLSLNKCFAKIARPITEPGKGAYWTVDLEAGEGNKRPRKRNKKPRRPQVASPELSMDLDEDGSVDGEESDQSSVVSDPRPTRGGYSFPPPAPPPSTRLTPHRSIAPRLSARRSTSNATTATTGLLTAAALGGQTRRIPVGPVGPMGEGRLRRILNDDDDESD